MNVQDKIKEIKRNIDESINYFKSLEDNMDVELTFKESKQIFTHLQEQINKLKTMIS